MGNICPNNWAGSFSNFRERLISRPMFIMKIFGSIRRRWWCLYKWSHWQAMLALLSNFPIIYPFRLPGPFHSSSIKHRTARMRIVSSDDLWAEKKEVCVKKSWDLFEKKKFRSVTASYCECSQLIFLFGTNDTYLLKMNWGHCRNYIFEEQTQTPMGKMQKVHLNSDCRPQKEKEKIN